MSQKKLSVVLATYNGSKYLMPQLESILNQERAPDEVVICDDASEDSTFSILERFRDIAPFSVIINRNAQRLGYRDNFGKALSLATGDLIFLSDQDDIWLSEKLLAVEEFARAYQNRHLFINDAFVLDSEGVRRKSLFDMRSRKSIEAHNMRGPGCCMAIRRDFLKILLPLPAFFKGHDNWINFCGAEMRATYMIERKLQFYRRHEASVTAETFAKPRPKMLNLVKLLLKKNAVSSGTSTRMKALCLLGERLDRLDASAPAFGGSRKTIRFEIEQEMNWAHNRLALRKRRGMKKIKAISAHYFSGDYDDSAGLKSALLDWWENGIEVPEEIDP